MLRIKVKKSVVGDELADALVELSGEGDEDEGMSLGEF